MVLGLAVAWPPEQVHYVAVRPRHDAPVDAQRVQILRQVLEILIQFAKLRPGCLVEISL